VGLYLDFGDDNNPFDTKFIENPDFKRNTILDKIKYLVFDEVSMVDMSAIKRLKKLLPMNVRFLLLGDNCQLPMIGVLDDKDSDLFDLPGYTLTETVRQKEGDEILKLADKIREYIVENKNMSSLPRSLPAKAIKDGKGYSYGMKDKCLMSLANSIKCGEDAIAVAFRNRTKDEINYTVRDLVHGSVETKFVVGDMVIFNNQFQPLGFWQYTKGGNIIYLPKGDPFAYNGERFKVLDIKEKLLKKSYLLSLYKSQEYLNNNWSDINKLKDIYNNIIGSGIWAYQLVLDGCEHTIDVLHEDGEAKFNEAKSHLEKLAYIHDNLNILTQFTRKFAQVTHGYAITIYKAQGQTIDKVYCNMSDVIECSKLSNKRKLQALYTGFSRAKNNLAIF
jgi:hypothetical protein